MKVFVKFAIAALASHCLHAAAAVDEPAPANRFVDSSCIVTFKAATQSEPSLILPPLKDPLLRVKNPPKFGEHGTAQSKEALAATLGI